jgi:hypothetical protein
LTDYRPQLKSVISCGDRTGAMNRLLSQFFARLEKSCCAAEYAKYVCSLVLLQHTLDAVVGNEPRARD